MAELVVGAKVRVRSGHRRGRVGVIERRTQLPVNSALLPIVVVRFADGTTGGYFPEEVIGEEDANPAQPNPPRPGDY